MRRDSSPVLASASGGAGAAAAAAMPLPQGGEVGGAHRFDIAIAIGRSHKRARARAKVFVAARERNAPETGELSFKAGDMIRVTKSDPQHSRSYGVNLTRGGRAGWMPTSFLKRNADDKDETPVPPSPRAAPAPAAIDDEPTNYSTHVTSVFNAMLKATPAAAASTSVARSASTNSLDPVDLEEGWRAGRRPRSCAAPPERLGRSDWRLFDRRAAHHQSGAVGPGAAGTTQVRCRASLLLSSSLSLSLTTKRSSANTNGAKAGAGRGGVVARASDDDGARRYGLTSRVQRPAAAAGGTVFEPMTQGYAAPQQGYAVLQKPQTMDFRFGGGGGASAFCDGDA